MSTEEKPQVPEATTTTVTDKGDHDIQPSDPAVEDPAVGSEAEALRGPNGEEYPTKEELDTLRRVKGKIHWLVYTVAFCELCERFAYYGTTIVFQNFISKDLPLGSRTGAGGAYGQSGALGLGQRAATGLTLFNQFWAYLMPLFGGYFADTYLGKFNTINVAIAVATFGHVLIVVSALPSVIAKQSVALAPFIIGLVFFGIGVGFFKVNVSPLIAEQYEAQQPRAVIKTLKSGERVIVDPVMTISSIYLRFYFFINVGSLAGQIAMPYAEKYVGFWLSFTLPTIMFLICPFVMLFCRKRYVRHPPTGSVLSKTLLLLGLAMKGRWSVNPIQTVRNMRAPDFWENVKPSRLGARTPSWMTFDDAWVDEVRRGLKACSVFGYYVIYWLSYDQLNNNLISQAASMRLDGVPNEVASILDPLALLIFIPIVDKIFYPALARAGFKLTPIKRITAGFYLGAAAMAVAAIVQHYIYVYSPCGEYASDCSTPPQPMSVWIQTPAYVLLAFSEIGASVTGLEYAFTKAPKNMRGLVTGVFWFAHAFSAALAQAFVGLAADPLLVWLYTAVAIISLLGGIGFWLSFRKLDAEEEALNTLPDSLFQGSQNVGADVEATLAAKEEQEKIRHAQGLDKVTENVRHG